MSLPLETTPTVLIFGSSFVITAYEAFFGLDLEDLREVIFVLGLIASWTLYFLDIFLLIIFFYGSCWLHRSHIFDSDFFTFPITLFDYKEAYELLSYKRIGERDLVFFILLLRDRSLYYTCVWLTLAFSPTTSKLWSWIGQWVHLRFLNGDWEWLPEVKIPS